LILSLSSVNFLVWRFQALSAGKNGVMQLKVKI